MSGSWELEIGVRGSVRPFARAVMNWRRAELVGAEVRRATLEAIGDSRQLNASIDGRGSLAQAKIDDGRIVELRRLREIRRGSIPENTEVDRLAVRLLPRRLYVLSERGE